MAGKVGVISPLKDLGAEELGTNRWPSGQVLRPGWSWRALCMRLSTSQVKLLRHRNREE